MFIVIECFGGPHYAAICINEKGENIVFDKIEEAQMEADKCQDGLVVEIN